MAVRLVTPVKRCVRTYLPSLQAVVQHFRSFSSQDERNSTGTTYFVDEPDISQVVWPDPSLGPLCTADRRFPLPGNVGVITDGRSGAASSAPLKEHTSYRDSIISFPSQPEERHFAVLTQYLSHDSQINEKESEFLPEEEMPKAVDLLECAAYDCPQILRKEFADLFPDRNTYEGPFTVITLCQHTENDMTMWSDAVEKERSVLLESFMCGAMEICTSLNKNGFWANFIDPATGKPAKGPHTNATFFETDERYRRLGFQIEDLGCCKVIRHPSWGTHAYVSCVFTNAPVDHAIISQLVSAKP